MNKSISIPGESIINKIRIIREQKVILDSDLAELYQVESRRLNEQVKRNIERFPEDFMFQLSDEEWDNLKSQFATSSWGGRRTLPYVFTEQGVAMLSSVLRSETAIKMNIEIIRTFTKMKQMLSTHKDILLKLEQMERKVENQDDNISLIFNHLNRLIEDKDIDRPEIGFKYE